MSFHLYVATGETYADLITAFESSPVAATTQSDTYGYSLIDADFYRTTQSGIIGERFNLSMVLNAGQNDVVTPHFALKIYESDLASSAIVKFQEDKTIHDYFPFKLFDISPLNASSPEDQVLAIIFRQANFEVFPANAGQISFNVAPQGEYPAMTFAAEVTGAAAPNDAGAVAAGATGYAFIYDSNGQRIRDFSGYDFANTIVEGQVLIQNVHPTVAWPSGRRGLITGTVRFTEETALGAPALIGMPTCCT